MHDSVRKLRDTYAIKPDAPFYHKEFGLAHCLPVWRETGLPENIDINEFFGFDEDAYCPLKNLGWCEAPFLPAF